jgi:hypothetical protein
LEARIEQISHKHQELIDPEIIDLVPMFVENIQTGLKPLFLAVRPALLGVFEINENLGNL